MNSLKNMFKNMQPANVFKVSTPNEIAHQQIKEVAESLAKLEALASHHSELANIYSNGAARLRGVPEVPQVSELPQPFFRSALRAAN